MGQFSRDTFNRLKHYVGVRLQKGVPLVDADWNEKEDIRKYELQAFLKWFVGNGVPDGNDGFRILSVAGNGINTIILTSNKAETASSSLLIDLQNSPAAEALGFGPDNYSASGTNSSPAQLFGTTDEPFDLGNDRTLVISTDGLPFETVTFNQSDFTDISNATAIEVVKVINNALNSLTASVGAENDFEIRGGEDGTPEKAGRCLVEGWDVINESNLKYTEQQLFNNEQLAADWGVDKAEDSQNDWLFCKLKLLNPSSSGPDTIYLDVWEREVDAEEDTELINPKIGIPTCTRLKREWVVRVAEGEPKETIPPHAKDSKERDHFFYPLAELQRTENAPAIQQEDITDLRLTGLKIVSYKDVQQIVKDAYGESYTLDHDSQPNLKISLREAINALLQGELPGTTAQPTIEYYTDGCGIDYFGLEDIKNRYIWVFFWWQQGIEYIRSRYLEASNSWERGSIVTGRGLRFFALKASNGEKVWLFYRKNLEIWYSQYIQETDSWQNSNSPLTKEGAGNYVAPFALEAQNGDVWVFWKSEKEPQLQRKLNIWANHYSQRSGNWQTSDFLVAKDVEDVANKDYIRPFALKDREGNIWVFWVGDKPGVWYRRYLQGTWESENQVPDSSGADWPIALEDRDGSIWVFWCGEGLSYSRYSQKSSGQWGWEREVLQVPAQGAQVPFALVAQNGDIWLFWSASAKGEPGYTIWYNRYRRYSGWERSVQLTVTVSTASPIGDLYPSALEDSQGDIWVFWSRVYGGVDTSIFCRKLIYQI